MNRFAARMRSLRRAGRFILLGAAVLRTPVLALAAEPAPAAQPAGTTELWFALFRMVGALALVLALFGVGLWLARRLPALRAGRCAPKLAVLEARSLGQRQALYVVGYEHERLLIATSPAGVTFLKQLPTVAPSAESAAAPPPPATEFARTLQNLLQGSRT